MLAHAAEKNDPDTWLRAIPPSTVAQANLAKIEENRTTVLDYKQHEDDKIGGMRAACAELATA